MVGVEVPVAIIQLVALFLPAWAVVMQVFTRLVKDTDFRESPLLIPMISFGFTVSILSLYLFGRAGFGVLTYFVEEGLITGSGPLANALVDAGLGGLAFVGLGGAVLIAIGFRHVPYPEVVVVFLLAVVFAFVMYLGWIFDQAAPMFAGLLLVFVVSWIGIIQYYTESNAGE